MLTKGLLSGLRVLDLTRVLAGPYATMIFGDLGADVIKIENPNGGDDTRSWGPPYLGSESLYYLSVNRNKRSVSVNIKHPTGLEIVKKIASKSDMLVENFVPGKLDKMGLGYGQLSKVNPGLVYCSISGFGPDGPLSTHPGYDVIATSMGGLINITGPENGEPCKVGIAVIDLATGLFAHGALLAALWKKEKTGIGCKIDCDLLSTQISFLTNVAANYLNADMEGQRLGTAHPTITPYQAFKTKDGRYMTVAAGNDHHFAELCELIGLPNLSKNLKFLHNSERCTHRPELVSILSEKFVEKTCSEWMAIFDAGKVPFSPINNLKEAFENPQVVHNKLVMEIDHPGIGEKLKVIHTPVKYSCKESYVDVTPPPALGEDTMEVLTSVAEYSENEVQKFIDNKIVFVPN